MKWRLMWQTVHEVWADNGPLIHKVQTSLKTGSLQNEMCVFYSLFDHFNFLFFSELSSYDKFLCLEMQRGLSEPKLSEFMQRTGKERGGFGGG